MLSPTANNIRKTTNTPFYKNKQTQNLYFPLFQISNFGMSKFTNERASTNWPINQSLFGCVYKKKLNLTLHKSFQAFVEKVTFFPSKGDNFPSH